MQTYPIYFMLPLHFLPYHVNKSCDGDHTGREHLSVAHDVFIRDFCWSLSAYPSCWKIMPRVPSDAVGPAWDSVTSWEWDPLRRLVTLLLFAFRHTKQTWIPFPSLFTTHVDVSKIRIPPLHTFNVPSCRTNHARSVGLQPIVVSWDRRKHILAVFHWPSKRTMLTVITIKCMFALAWVPFTCCRF